MVRAADSHEKFEEIHARIRAKERERAAAVERGLREQLGREKVQIEAKAKAEVEKAGREAAATVAKARAEAAAKEAAIREEVMKAAQTALAPRIAEADRAKLAAEQQLQSVKASHEAVLTQRLQEQRSALEQAKTEAVNAERSKAFNEKLKVEEKLQEVQRKLQQKTADELGEGAEVDLFEALKAEFPGDQISRVNKGTPGADIIQDVVHDGIICGRIIYDSKNRHRWRNEYVSKLREDQLAAKADHAVLSSPVFPGRARYLHIQDGVIVINPTRTTTLVEILRKHLVQSHGLRQSNKAREEKTARLYEFITSDRCGQLLDQIDTLTDDLLELDVKEKKAHDLTWRRRGELVKAAQRAHGNFTGEIERIIGTAAADDGQD